MNKRSFIKSLLLAAVAPSVLVPKFADAHKWKRTTGMWVPNPEFSSREFCGNWVFTSQSFDMVTRGPAPGRVITLSDWGNAK